MYDDVIYDTGVVLSSLLHQADLSMRRTNQQHGSTFACTLGVGRLQQSTQVLVRFYVW